MLKLGDFGMARDIYFTEYYRKTGTGMLPLRWMAPESLFDGIYNVKTDIWMFGMLMIEIFTYGELPWSEYDDIGVLSMSKHGSKHAQPVNCPDEVYNVMLCCWEKNPLKRATAVTINDMLGRLELPDALYMYNLLQFNSLVPNPNYHQHNTPENIMTSSNYTILTGGTVGHRATTDSISSYYQVPASSQPSSSAIPEPDSNKEDSSGGGHQGIHSEYTLLTVATAENTPTALSRVLSLKQNEDEEEEETHL